ncbi:hypothetical protein HPB52_010992 [Rhipicephalus sanguineus]|uniref:Uncharacterized protein n=1 Tax=Rhipicephalus sanguineus TaxID=34632 RepID=A0A9D4SSM6_RHISA|nr:hypothetical protein HPB52_010992 [Rhipicephalus sanguineus]
MGGPRLSATDPGIHLFLREPSEEEQEEADRAHVPLARPAQGGHCLHQPRRRHLPLSLRTRQKTKRAPDQCRPRLPADAPGISLLLLCLWTLRWWGWCSTCSFHSFPRFSLVQALSSRPGVAAIRVNQHRNIVAVDVTFRGCLKQHLALTELQGIPVTAREPADHRSSVGFVHGVDGNLLMRVCCPAPCLRSPRTGDTLQGTLPCAASQAPTAPMQDSVDGTALSGDVQLAGELHPLRPDPPGRGRVPAAPVHQLREARTYASVVKGHTLPARPTPAPRTRYEPPPAATALPPTAPAIFTAAAPSPSLALPPLLCSCLQPLFQRLSLLLLLPPPQRSPQ